MGSDRLPTGLASLDRLLGGGLETDTVTELYGEGGSGKTVFCLELAARVARAGRWVLYVDTEGVSLERLRAVGGADLDRILARVLLAAPKDLEQQSRAVATACALARGGRRDIGLIVLDSATNFYRLSLAGPDEDEAREALAGQIADLVATARALGTTVLLTNQVWRNPRDGALEPLGGSFLNHAAKTILRFERREGPLRTVVLMKHRARPGGSADFRITSSGLASVGAG
jgi:DNA repair protein RadB